MTLTENVKRMLAALRWKAKQRLAGSSRYYGDGGTIHHTGHLDVETYKGEVVAVWYRCQPLPFKQAPILEGRAQEMRSMYDRSPAPGITRVAGLTIRCVAVRYYRAGITARTLKGTEAKGLQSETQLWQPLLRGTR